MYTFNDANNTVKAENNIHYIDPVNFIKSLTFREMCKKPKHHETIYEAIKLVIEKSRTLLFQPIFYLLLFL